MKMGPNRFSSFKIWTGNSLFPFLSSCVNAASLLGCWPVRCGINRRHRFAPLLRVSHVNKSSPPAGARATLRARRVNARWWHHFNRSNYQITNAAAERGRWKQLALITISDFYKTREKKHSKQNRHLNLSTWTCFFSNSDVNPCLCLLLVI